MSELKPQVDSRMSGWKNAVCWRMGVIVKGMPGGMLVKFGWTDRKINFGAEQIHKNLSAQNSSSRSQ